MPGPAPLPAEIKKKRGTHRPSRDAPDPMQAAPLTTIPTAPDDLPERGRQEWYRAAGQLAAFGILATVDLVLLHQYCRCVVTMEEAQHHLSTEGYTITMHNKGGGMYPVKSPWVSIYNEALTLTLKIAQQYGFTPSSRTKISAPKADQPEDPWQEL